MPIHFEKTHDIHLPYCRLFPAGSIVSWTFLFGRLAFHKEQKYSETIAALLSDNQSGSFRNLSLYDSNCSSFWNYVFFSKHLSTHKTQKPSKPACDFPSSLPYKIDIYKGVSKSSRTVLIKRSLLTLDVKFLHHLQSTPLLHEYSCPSISAMLGSIPGSPCEPGHCRGG